MSQRRKHLIQNNTYMPIFFSVIYDGLAARISKHVVFAGPTNCTGAMAWE
jgi:hypothetical protein